MANPLIIDSKYINLLARTGKSSVAEKIPVAATAILFVPAIDYFNPDVDKSTREYSALKTSIKIGIGTITSFLARAVGQNIGEKITEKGLIKPISERISQKPELMKSFAESVGKYAAFITAMIAVLVLDIPLINKALNFSSDKLAKDNNANKKFEVIS